MTNPTDPSFPVTPTSPTPTSPAPASPTPTSPAPVTPTSLAPVTPTSPAPVTPASPAPVAAASPAPVAAASPAPLPLAAPSPTGHGHGHAGSSHAGHSHANLASANTRQLSGALALIVGFLLVEVVVGIIAGSLALLSDAAHMLTDAAAIALALAAFRLARRPARGYMTYGWRRVEILAAQVNGLTLLLLGVWLGYASIRRLISPEEVTGGLVLITALVGIVVNLAATMLLSRADRTSLNVEGAFQHVLNDLFAFVAAAVAGLVVMLTGFDRADPIASLVVVALMFKAGVGLVRESGRILVEAAPAGLDPDEISGALHERPHVTEVHDLHVWEITSASPALSAHVLVDPGADCHAVRLDLVQVVGERYGITHVTLQVDHDGPSGHHAVVPLTLGSGAAPCHSDDCEQH